ncbi:MAG: hypothetical protein NTV24_04955 [Candidatus Woesebacteria bacterium]|nr:hypothetical protein [Candidatus Woesebacteria bacterium]
MSFNIVSAKISGIPNALGWTQVHEFKPEEEEKLLKRGHLFAVFSTKKKEEGLDSVTAGRELLSRLHEEYFGNLEMRAFIALKNAVSKVSDEFSKTWGDVEISTVVVLEDVVYSAAVGGGKVVIYRDGAVATILESTGSETIIASGYPKEGDYIILGSKLFFENIPFGTLKASLEGPDLSSSIESLAPQVSASTGSGNMGAVVIGFGKKIIIEKVVERVIKPNIPKRINFAFAKNIFAFLTKILPERKIYVREKNLDDQAGVGKKTTFYVGIGLLILLFVSIGFGIKQNLTKRYKSTYQEELTLAKNNLNEAETIFSTDPKRARELFLDSKSKVDNLLSKKIEDKELTSLDVRLKEKEAEILGIYKEEPSLYLDLSLLSSGFSGDKLILSGGNVFVFDKNGKKIVKIAIDTKKTQIVAGPEQVEGATDIFAYQDSVYGVFSDGIYSLGTAKKKVIEKTWDGDILPYAYTGNTYILDKAANIIWRYQGTADGFGVKQNWIAPKITPDFRNAKQIVIDGTIWILSDPFNIFRFSQGSPQAFKPQGVYPGIVNITAIHSNEENKYIYLLDKEEGRVVVLEKNGNYKAQYQSDQFKMGVGIIVSEKTSKMVILTKEKLIQVDLKHL